MFLIIVVRGRLDNCQRGSRLLAAPCPVVVPRTIRALLAARVDQLDVVERQVLEGGWLRDCSSTPTSSELSPDNTGRTDCRSARATCSAPERRPHRLATRQSGKKIARRDLLATRAGSILELHDAGSDRSARLAALPRSCAGSRPSASSPLPPHKSSRPDRALPDPLSPNPPIGVVGRGEMGRAGWRSVRGSVGSRDRRRGALAAASADASVGGSAGSGARARVGGGFARPRLVRAAVSPAAGSARMRLSARM